MFCVRKGGLKFVILESLTSSTMWEDIGTGTRIEGSIVRLVFDKVIFTLGLVRPAKVPGKEETGKK